MKPELQNLLSSIDIGKVLAALFIIVGSVFVARVLQSLNSRFAVRFPQFRLRGEQISTVLQFLILLSGVVLAILSLFGFSREMILAVGGSLAVAIGFGLKDIAASVLSGFVVLFERPYQVGDRIKFSGAYGDVIGIGLRSTKIRTLDDNIVTVPNSIILSDEVASANAGALDMMVQADFYVAPSANLDKVERLVREAVIASRFTYLEKPICVLFEDVFIEHHYCVRVRLKAYVVETRYEKPFVSDVTKRLHIAFIDAAIPLAIESCRDEGQMQRTN